MHIAWLKTYFMGGALISAAAPATLPAALPNMSTKTNNKQINQVNRSKQTLPATLSARTPARSPARDPTVRYYVPAASANCASCHFRGFSLHFMSSPKSPTQDSQFRRFLILGPVARPCRTCRTPAPVTDMIYL